MVAKMLGYCLHHNRLLQQQQLSTGGQTLPSVGDASPGCRTAELQLMQSPPRQASESPDQRAEEKQPRCRQLFELSMWRFHSHPGRW